MRGAGGAAARWQRGAVQLLDAQQPQSDDASDDIDDGVESTHFMEVDRVALDAVHAGLSVGEALEDSGGALLVAGVQGRCRDEREDVGQFAVGLRRLRQLDVRLGGGKAGA